MFEYVIRLSKLNKKSALLKQQQQQLKMRLQAAKEKLAEDEAKRKAAAATPLHTRKKGDRPTYVHITLTNNISPFLEQIVVVFLNEYCSFDKK